MESNWFVLLLCCLGVFRCAEAVAVDAGPFHIFLLLRKACKNHPVLCEFITCVYCLSGWISMIAVAYLAWASIVPLGHVVIWWAGIWGGAMTIMRGVRARE